MYKIESLVNVYVYDIKKKLKKRIIPSSLPGR